MTPKVKWSVSLSNGQTIYEGKGDFQIIEGSLSPWLKLKELIKNEGLKITSLCLYTDDNKRWNLHSAGKNPRFSIFNEAEKPIDYRMFRKVGVEGLGGEKIEEKFVIIEAIYNDKKLQIWVSEDNPNTSWSIIV